jgi:hypothetical protein
MTAKLRNNRRAMTPEQIESRQARLAPLAHWAKCRKCGFMLKGTLADLKEHTCVESS